MSRFIRADDRPSYSELKPERFIGGERYVAPEEAHARGEVRAIDDAPAPDDLQVRGARARRGFEGMKT